MKNDKGWTLLLAVATAGAAGGVAGALLSRRQRERRIAGIAHKADIKSWENEGGNLRPPAS